MKQQIKKKNSPFEDAGTAKAAAACILILKLEESRRSSNKMLKTDDDLQCLHASQYRQYIMYVNNICGNSNTANIQKYGNINTKQSKREESCTTQEQN